MSSEPKIRLDKVGKTYPGTKVPAVEELTLDVQPRARSSCWSDRRAAARARRCG